LLTGPVDLASARGVPIGELAPPSFSRAGVDAKMIDLSAIA
jgi:hypothetical protein